VGYSGADLEVNQDKEIKMCLQVVYDKPPKPEGFGWKVFYESYGLFSSGFRKIFRPMKTNKWLKEQYYRLIYGQDRHAPLHGYPLGWHIYVLKKYAESNRLPPQVVRKVQYKNAHTIGYKYGEDIIVAKEIKIL
jgi:hypothetical protein